MSVIDVKKLSLARARETKHKKNYKWTMEKRIEVVTKVMALGNMRLVSDLTGVPHDLIRAWKGQSWWKDVAEEIKTAQKLQVDNKLTKIINKALDVVEDRLDNGDIVLNPKTMEVSRKPVSIKEARGAANDMLQRQAILEKLKLDENLAQSKVTVNEQLELLKAEFAKFQTNRTIDVVATVVAPGDTNALSNERPSELQKGIREVRFEAGTNQSPFGEESGESGSEEEWDECEWEGRGSQDPSEQGWDEFSEESESGEQDDQPEFQQKL